LTTRKFDDNPMGTTILNMLKKSIRRSIVLSALGLSLVGESAWADFEKGLEAYMANNLPLAYKEFRASAEEGHGDSQFNLALMFENGMGIPKDETQALEWYLKSAKQGNAAAQYNLGVLFENGRGTKVDFAKAQEWYRKASVQGDAYAIGNLGMLYIRGDGVPENKIVGVALLLVSVTLDNSPDNLAKKNIMGTRGLTPDLITTAQTLADAMTSAKDMLVPLDAYLKQTQKN
jgi:uncharacterized protein